MKSKTFGEILQIFNGIGLKLYTWLMRFLMHAVTLLWLAWLCRRKAVDVIQKDTVKACELYPLRPGSIFQTTRSDLCLWGTHTSTSPSTHTHTFTFLYVWTVAAPFPLRSLQPAVLLICYRNCRYFVCVCACTGLFLLDKEMVSGTTNAWKQTDCNH